jgi:transposase
MDFRRRVAALYGQGYETSEVVEVMGCSASWARRLKQRLRETGTLEPVTPTRPDQRTYCDDDEQKIRELIAANPDATLAEVAEAIAKPASLSTVSRTLDRLDLPRKKSPRTPRSGTAPT